MKTCTKCNITKPKNEFYKDSSKKDGLTPRCKDCEKVYQNKRYKPRPKVDVVCVVCETCFKGRPNQKYCNDRCKWKAKQERNGRTMYTITCKGCGKEGQVTSKHSKYCSQECFHKHDDFSHVKEATYAKTCDTCSKGFISGNSNALYCSDECNPHKWKRCAVSFNNCKMCGELFTTNYKSQNCCSAECTWKRARNIKYPLKEIIKTCPECDTTFKVEYRYGHDRHVYCSERCAQRVVKRNRKYRKRNNGVYEKINRTQVFRRDKWKCQECGIKTPKSLMGKRLENSPTLDHIVPLSLGGCHTHGNVQLLCRRCNSIKSNNYEGQMVLL